MIQEMYRVRSSVGETDGFEVKVGQLSSFIFNIVMDVTTRNVRETVSWSILYADDIALLDACGNMDEEVKHRVQAGWNNWRSASRVLCDKKVPLRLKGKFHRVVIRPTMPYGTETVNMKETEEKRMDVTEMRMLRWMCRVQREDRIRNEYIRESTMVVEISKKIQDGRLRRYGHLLRGRKTMLEDIQWR
nr:uncharacterized protein LOC113814926 [Penaeus vannamei]